MIERGRHRSALRLAAIGLALAPGAPIGLWLLSVVFEPDPPFHFALIYSALATAIVFASFGAWAGGLMDRLRAAAMRDGLTGLFNRRFLREALPNLQAGSRRRGEPLCLLMLDLDHFKQVNDQYGHIVGDQTLRAVAEVLRTQSRRSDLVARFGGEEFAVVCPSTDGPTGLQVAERLRESIAGLGVDELGHGGTQTISIGVAVQTDQSFTPEQLIDRADLALYQAKHGGRNRAVVWVEPPEADQSLPASSSTSRAWTPGSTPG